MAQKWGFLKLDYSEKIVGSDSEGRRLTPFGEDIDIAVIDIESTSDEILNVNDLNDFDANFYELSDVTFVSRQDSMILKSLSKNDNISEFTLHEDDIVENDQETCNSIISNNITEADHSIIQGMVQYSNEQKQTLITRSVSHDERRILKSNIIGKGSINEDKEACTVVGLVPYCFNKELKK